MDAQEMKDALLDVRKRLEAAKDMLNSLGMRIMAWEVSDLLRDLDETIEDADNRAHRERMEEEALMTQAFFRDSYDAFCRLGV